jgi:glutamate-1-semialdehyde 2,1-aminomutase
VTRTGSSLLDVERRYTAMNKGSAHLYERAQQVMPGGTTRTSVFFLPNPVYITRGDGCRVWDVDGNERLDFICNYTALILGHAHPNVVAAIHQQATKGTAFAATNPLEVELASELCARVPSVEQVRFCNSGTEATMFAMRLARTFTGRTKIARMEGGYHGTHDFAEVSTHPDLVQAGPAQRPVPVADSPGTLPWAIEQTVVLPFNDATACERILTAEADDIAAVIVEPVMGSGGCISPVDGFLQTLRVVSARLGILLIFDEVISLRVSYGGAQERFAVVPDLTTMGKIIGGGLPVAAFGGRPEIMELLDPRNARWMPQGGTYNGNPLGMAAGLATMHELTHDAFAELETKGSQVRDGLRDAFDSADVAAQVTGVGSLFAVHLTDQPILDYRSTQSADKTLAHAFFLEMLNQGVLLAPRGMGAIPIVATEDDIARFLEAAGAAARSLTTLVA